MRVRLRYTKAGKIRFASHRDLARAWERALRKADVPVSYSAGFAPRPKLSFGLALSTGHESEAEYLDVELDAARLPAGFAVGGLPARLSPALPQGIDVTGAAVVEPGAASLQHAVTSSSWRIEVAGAEVAAVARAVADTAAAPSLVARRRRKGREVVDDLRPAILHLAVVGPTPAGVELDAELATHPRSVRPCELVEALAGAAGADWVEGRVRRMHQWTQRDGAREEPLAPPAAPDATPRPHAEARA
jgi:radical SAM-linked protein